MTRLPAWASTPVCRELLQAILAEHPTKRTRQSKLPSIYGSHREPSEERFEGNLAARLRRIRMEWVDQHYGALNRQHEASGHWDEEASRAVLLCESADALIERLVAEEAGLRDAA